MRMKIVFSVVVIFLISCNTQNKNYKKQQALSEKNAHSSRNSIDWAGTYRGVLPCADCDGVQMELSITKKSTYELKKRYEGSSTEIITESGNFRWLPEGNVITIYSGNSSNEYTHFLVGENKLVKLDRDANPIKNEFSQMYVLKKKGFDDRITEKHWQLIELNGKKIEPSTGKLDIHFKLKYKDSRMMGYGGCNRFSGHFELMDGNRIYFTKVENTLIACKALEQEVAFLKVFELADKYSIKKDTLSLFKTHNINLAKFKAIYMN